MFPFPQKRLFVIVLALIVLFTGIFAFTHLDHDCTGEDCPLCLQIEIAKQVFKGFGLAAATFLAAGFAVNGNGRAEIVQIFSIRFASPITLNVKSTS
jgi:hypothetical protein